MRSIKCAILFSGNGSNMQNLIESLHNKIFYDNANNPVRLETTLTLCNNPSAYGITRTHHLAIPCKIINHKDFSSRSDFDNAMIEMLRAHSIDIVLLAGFMRILTSCFTQAYQTINIHPSFLPEHKGANAIKESFNSTQSYGGVSVHWVNEELDSGEIIAQEKLHKIPNESLEDFTSRIHALEYSLYPRAILLALGLKDSVKSVEELQ
ncbi:phosphoribosylglycinamide formyltransferase [Helicobacter sp. MIT 21-1697]|uniref:phosphoribosylglycinamide formyltransferase n=1 Tax=Helicobacter sp. MIT 21-1697 TaxID=2993733 RepID=UPI00224A8817|nr:phosphoribosylglycinamide formyltransferase [Helicobacter sp. MIT 21-1697]MCX2716381.1 phosphoribosylglycinamide formyltransferase [Helicobacter sp. MIT 21-1697]